MAAKHGQFTDPFQPEDRIDKLTPSQTDQVQTEAGKAKWMRSPTDNLHNPQALNPQPLPPGFQDETTIQIPKGFPTGQGTSKPMWGVGRGLGVVLVLVLVLVLLSGIGIALHVSQGGQPVLLSSPGVYAWEDSASVGQKQTGLTTPCKGTLAPGFEQRLIGGGYTLSRSQVPLTARPALDASSTRDVSESWDTGFAPSDTGAQLTNYAICLREPSSFFGSTIQYESTEMKTFAIPGPQAIKATCPAGTSVLGGGYVIQPYQLEETQPATIDSSFPYADDSGAGWEIVANSINGLDQAQAWAVCSGTLHTHVESASVPNDGLFQSSISCAQGTLLGGGFDLLQQGDNSVSTDYARQDSPGQTLHQDTVQGDTFSDWRVIGEINGVGSHYTATLWAVCWDQNGAPPVTAPTAAPTQAPTAAPTVAATSTPVAAPTASPVPQPTATTPPSCSVVHNGTVQFSSTTTEYVNLDTGATSSSSTGANLGWTLLPGTTVRVFSNVNGSSLASQPTQTNQTCAQIEKLTYNKNAIEYTSGSLLFAVKLQDGHYAEVQATTVFGLKENDIKLVWTTYYP